MTLNIVSEVWEALKTHIDLNEKKEAADTLINVLIDNGYEYSDIKESFGRDKEILQALSYYDESQQTDLDFEEESDDDEWD